MLIEVIRLVVSGWGCGEGHGQLFFFFGEGLRCSIPFTREGGPRVKTFVQIN